MGVHDSHGAYGRELLALIRRAGLGERVRFAGDVDDLPAATGWLVPPDDPGELAVAMGLALAMEDGARRRLAARARAFVVDEFGI